MATIYTEFRAPYPNPKDTMIFPRPLFQDIRRSEQKVTVKRTMLGETWTYVDSSDRHTLVLPFRLTRVKAIELGRFLDVYKAAPMQLDLYDGSKWNVQLVREPVARTSTNGIGEITKTGGETVEVTMTFSGVRLN